MKKIICALIIIFIIFSTIVCTFVSAYEDDYTSAYNALAKLSGDELKQKSLRLHIIANSDTPQDQMIKLALKDELTVKFADIFSGTEDIDEAVELAEEYAEDMRAFAEEYLAENGLCYGCTAEIGKSTFPEKTYDGIVFPDGEYKAFKLVLGEGKGKNWWCVLYPPLCVYKLHRDKSLENNDTAETSSDGIKLKWKLSEFFKR